MSDCTYESAIRELREAQERISEKNQRINELGEENARLRKELEIRKSGTERWLPCPDHRDKVDYRSACPECQMEQMATFRTATAAALRELRAKFETCTQHHAEVSKTSNDPFTAKLSAARSFAWRLAAAEIDATIAKLGLEPDAFDALIASRPDVLEMLADEALEEKR